MKRYLIILILLLLITTGCSNKNEVVTTSTTTSTSTSTATTTTTSTSTTTTTSNNSENIIDTTTTTTSSRLRSTSSSTSTTTTTSTTKKTTNNVKKNPIIIYVFHGDGCPHCAELFDFLELLSKDNDYKDKFKVISYEVWYNYTNSQYHDRVAEYFEITSRGVPFYVIGDIPLVGYSSRLNDNIKATIDDAYNRQVKDIVSTIK